MSLQICLAKGCTCTHHLLLDLLKKKENYNVKLLLENVENFCELADSSGLTLLHYAAKYDNATVVQHLINRGCNINARDQLGATPLTVAITSENLSMIELLLKNNADLYEPANTLQLILSHSVHSFMIRGKQNYQPILESIYEKLSTDFLSEKRENVVSLLNDEDSAKLVAVVFGIGELTNFVLNNNYPLEFKETMGGCTALHCAIMFARIQNAKMLIERGAKVNAVNNMDYAPFTYYSDECESIDERYEVLKSLASNLTEPYARDRGRKNMERLIEKRSKRVVKAVLQSGMNLNTYFRQGVKSLLRLLMSNEDPDIFDLLDELGIDYDVNERIPLGRTMMINNVSTPLVTTILLATTGIRCVPKVKFLLKRGADANITPLKRDVALTVLIGYCRLPEEPEVEAEIMDLLLQHETDTQIVDPAYRVNKWSYLHCLERFKDRFAFKVILAHLALLRALNLPPLTNVTRRKIMSDQTLKAHYDLCIRQLGEMKNVKVRNRVSLFELLNEKDERKIMTYARDEEFFSEFNIAIENLERYYYSTLHNKMVKAMDKIQLELKAAIALGELTKLCHDLLNAIVHQIISYLEDRDLNNLCAAVNRVTIAD